MFRCFTDKAFLKKFIKISLPVMISGFITFLVSFLDNIMVGTVSNDVVSGVYAANQVTFLINMCIFGVIEGAGIFIQQYNGTSDSYHIKHCHLYKWAATIILLLVLIPLVYLFGSKLIYVYCHKDSNCESILYQGTNYLKVVAISYIPFAISQIYSSSLKETSKTKIAMYSGIVAIVCNALFNFIFIIVLNMGGFGAAIATIIARVFEMLYLVFVCHLRKYEFCCGVFKSFKLEMPLYSAITKKGFLLFLNEIGFALGTVLQSLAFSQRDGVLSAISIVSTISNIFGILITGLSVGIGVMVGGDLGANEFEMAKEDNKKLNFFGFYMAIVIGILLVILSPFIPYLFKEVDATQKVLATKLIIIYGLLLWANLLAVTSYFTLRVGGKTIETFILDTGMMILVYVPVSWVLAYYTSLDMVFIYLIVRSIDAFKALLGIFLMKKGGWVRNITIK